MPDILSKGSKFDPVLVKELFDKVKGKSSLAALCGQTPIPFNGQKEFIFTMDDEVDLVAENGKMTRGSVSLDPVIIVPVKIEYGARISDEFLYAAEEEQIAVSYTHLRAHETYRDLVCLVLSRKVCDSGVLFRKLACKVGYLAVKVGCLCLEIIRGNIPLKLLLDCICVAVKPCLYRIVKGFLCCDSFKFCHSVFLSPLYPAV